MKMKHIYKRYILSCLLVLASYATLAGDVRAEDARDLIKKTAEGVIAHVKINRLAMEEDPAQLYAMVNEKLAPHVDFQRMSRWILGKHWRKASDDQKSQFTDEFKKLMIKTYATALLKLSDEEISYPPIKGETRNGKVSIKSEIVTPDGRRFTVLYRMHHKDQSWKIYDISVDGVSLISTYRSSFATEIRQVGLDGLLDNLENKNEGVNI